ncbi:APC family permease [Planosporangium mesophilum]|uniref:Amino acid permease n=1 Tax=Planosporangium mesophilum TaxID=689768 RepID=A0A8J3TA73_9ACTN|nr:APC family permease [Planosporangium mesophilum]NJC84418.1 APC family permease [Planosporangium mesophilum]GII23440.1 amino acid permease [Planosporangium mesophilum]
MSTGSTSRRKLKLWEALALSLGLMGPTLAMGGNGQGLIDSVGKAVPLVFVLGCIGVGLVAYGFVRLTRYYNHSGNAYALVGATIGPRAGFFAGFAQLGTYLFFSICTLAALGAFTNALLAAAQPDSKDPFQLPWVVTALIGLALSAFLNTRDTKTVARALLVIEGIGIVFMIVLAFVIIGKGGADSTGLDVSTFTLSGVSVQAVMGAVVAAFLSWAGFEACASLGEETDNPRRNIPRALSGAVLLTSVLFVFVMFAQIIGFGTDSKGLEAFKGSGNTLGALGQSYIGLWFGLVILFTAVMSAFASHLSSAATASRMVYALARDGFGPKSLAELDPKHGSPRNALWVVLAVTAVVDFISWASDRPQLGTGDAALDSYFYFAIIGTVCLMFTYLMVEVGVIRFIATGRVAIPRYEIVVPILGVGVIAAAFYFNVKGQDSLLNSPYIAFAWCAVGLIIVLAAPGLARRIGTTLTAELGTHANGQPAPAASQEA